MAFVSSIVEWRVDTWESPEAGSNRITVYDWFTSEGTPPRPGNEVRILVDGEETWQQVWSDIEAAETEIHIATWVCRPNMELLRPRDLALSDPERRVGLRFGDVVEKLAAKGVSVRILIWGMAYTPIINRWLRKWFRRAMDRIDVLEQDHPVVYGSHHQKTITIDGRIGYCGGMNIKENDWDSCDHEVFDARRHPHTATGKLRHAVRRRDRRSAFPPRHDLVVRMVGPVVGDLEGNFHARWRASLQRLRDSLWRRLMDLLRGRSRTHDMAVLPPAKEPTHSGDRWVQVVRTTPGGEHGILDAYKRAIANARKYIYIENQYFRSTVIADALAQALLKNPQLKIACVVWPINDGKRSYFDPSGYWTAHTQNAIRAVRENFHLTRLMVSERDSAGKLHWTPVDVHAKVMVIDDVWITVGSANINDRGFKYEGEINAVIVDDVDAKALRMRLMAEHLQVPEADVKNFEDAFVLWEKHSKENGRRRDANEEPLSRVHAFTQQAPPWPAFLIGSGVF